MEQQTTQENTQPQMTPEQLQNMSEKEQMDYAMKQAGMTKAGIAKQMAGNVVKSQASSMARSGFRSLLRRLFKF